MTKPGSKTRNAQARTDAAHRGQAYREGRCGHEWRYPKVGGPARRVCKRCGRWEWLDKAQHPEQSIESP